MRPEQWAQLAREALSTARQDAGTPSVLSCDLDEIASALDGLVEALGDGRVVNAQGDTVSAVEIATLKGVVRDAVNMLEIALASASYSSDPSDFSKVVKADSVISVRDKLRSAV